MRGATSQSRSGTGSLNDLNRRRVVVFRARLIVPDKNLLRKQSAISYMQEEERKQMGWPSHHFSKNSSATLRCEAIKIRPG